MRILITEVTEMHGANFCVAGWCPATNAMVRPLPNNANWTAPLLAQRGIVPGATVDVSPKGRPTGAFPHRTEDMPIDSAATVFIRAGGQWFAAGAPPTAPTLSQAFEGQVDFNGERNGTKHGVYVPVDTHCRSLWGVRIPVGSITFVEEFEKLKAVLDDGNSSYKLAVSSRSIKETWRAGGMRALGRLLPAHGELHVRVGLARAFGSPADKCYAMINGINW